MQNKRSAGPRHGTGAEIEMTTTNNLTEIVPLSAVEQQDLDRLESVVERGLAAFVEVGNALLTIRDGKLYRQTHTSFERYLADRYEIKRSRAYQLMDAAKITTSLSTICGQPVPSTESQARELANLPVETAAAVMAAAGKSGSVTARSIAAARDEITGTSARVTDMTPEPDFGALVDEYVAAVDGRLDVLILEALSNRVDVVTLIGALTMLSKSLDADFGESAAAPIRRLVIDSRINMLITDGTRLSAALAPPASDPTFKPYTTDELRGLVEKISSAAKVGAA